MLIELRVANHRSIRDEQVLTLEPAPGKSSDDPRLRRVEGSKKPLFTTAGIYGANASGKSNLLSGLAFMRHAVHTSYRFWEPEGGVPRSPFAWGPTSDEPSIFEVLGVLHGTRFRYGFAADDRRILEEWLEVWMDGRRQRLYERVDDSVRAGRDVLPPGTAQLRPNALLLSVAAQQGNKRLTPFFSWFKQIDMHRVPAETGQVARLVGLESGLVADVRYDAAMLHAGAMLADMKTLLAVADVGIRDVRVAKATIGSKSAGPPKRFELLHQATHEEAWLPLEEESHGTQTLFQMAPSLMSALRDGGIVVVDELESSLHTSIAAHIVRLFNSPRTNPKNAQLVFTTHDTRLIGRTLGDPELRSDQVWLTEKDNEGATVLYPLSDFKLPKGTVDLERSYLQGRFGAIPLLSDVLVGRE